MNDSERLEEVLSSTWRQRGKRKRGKLPELTVDQIADLRKRYRDFPDVMYLIDVLEAQQSRRSPRALESSQRRAEEAERQLKLIVELETNCALSAFGTMQRWENATLAADRKMYVLIQDARAALRLTESKD